jgi:hypothetical protein
VKLEKAQYAFVCLMRNPYVKIHASETRPTGVLAVDNRKNGAVAKASNQTPPPDLGVDTFAYWIPMRRPGGHNLAITLDPPLDVFGPESVRTGLNSRRRFVDG